MHKHDFVGAQSIYTRAILANKKIYMHDFFCGGHLGGTENLWGARPRSYAPLWGTYYDKFGQNIKIVKNKYIIYTDKQWGYYSINSLICIFISMCLEMFLENLQNFKVS